MTSGGKHAKRLKVHNHTLLSIMGMLIWQMRRSAKFYDGKFPPSQSVASPAFIAKLEEIAYAAGAKDVKYAKVPANAIFQHKGIPHEYAIVISVEMDKENIATSPSFTSFKEVANGYKNLAVIGNKMARFMQRNGFAAYPGTALGGIIDYVHLAEVAGMGTIGYHGLLITPNEGARLRINTIYTNITNLPIETENDHLWVRDFCAVCRKCVRKCPVESGKLLKGSQADTVWTQTADGRIRPPEVERGRTRMLSASGKTDTVLRQSAEAFVTAQWEHPRPNTSPTPPELRPYLKKLVLHAYRILDDDIVSLRNAGYSDEMIYEITIVGAFGTALVGLEKLFEVLYGTEAHRSVVPND